MRLTFSLLALALVPFAAATAAPPPPTPDPAAYAPPPLTPANTWYLDLSTGGRVTIQLRPDKAPLMVQRIKTLTCSGFYDGLKFHRVIPGFMAQGGDPKGTGEGGSTLPDVKAEFNDLPHVRGAVAAARAQDENSANSQFYIMLQPNLKLDNHYTVFGRVVGGMQYVDAITPGGADDGNVEANASTVVHATMGQGGCDGIATQPVASLYPSATVAPVATPPGGAAAAEAPPSGALPTQPQQ